MKEQLKRMLIFARNSIKKSKECKLMILGNLLHTRIRAQGNSILVIEKGCRIRNASFVLKGTNNRVLIEEDVFFSGKIELIGDGNELIIGNNTRINGAELIVHNGTKIEIGPGCLFSTNIDVRTTDSHSIFNFDGERINPDKNIHIGEHVWIGRMVSILKGAKIGNGSVIGSMSLVSGIIPNEVIAAGVPARPIREKIIWKE
jgi:acetyltransferase-like isoleucine patch superfamily enzyme